MIPSLAANGTPFTHCASCQKICVTTRNIFMCFICFTSQPGSCFMFVTLTAFVLHSHGSRVAKPRAHTKTPKFCIRLLPWELLLHTYTLAPYLPMPHHQLPTLIHIPKPKTSFRLPILTLTFTKQVCRIFSSIAYVIYVHLLA